MTEIYLQKGNPMLHSIHENTMALKFYRKESNVFDSDTTMVTRGGTSRSKLVLLFLVLLLGAGLIFAGIRFLSLNSAPSSSNSASTSLTPTPFATAVPEEPTPTTEVTPTGPTGKPTPTSKLSSKITPTPTTSTKPTTLSIEILNGSGQGGVAGTAASALKKLGYKITGTGNADTFNFVGYTIKIKKSKSSELPTLKKDVATLGTVTDSLTTLPESSDADAQVIVGK